MSKQSTHGSNGQETKAKRFKPPSWLTKNLGYKALALLCAILFWIFVLYTDDSVTRTKEIEVPLTIINEDTLGEDQDLILASDRNTIPKNVRVRVRSKISEYSRISANNVTASINMADVDSAGDSDLHVNVALQPYFTDKAEASEWSPEVVNLTFDSRDTLTLPVTVEYTGELPSGYWHGDAVLQPEEIELVGPQSEISKVSKVVCTVNLDGLTETQSLAITPVILDQEGVVIDSSAFKLNVSAIAATVEVYPTKQVTIDASAALANKDQVREGYMVESTRLQFNQIEIAGPQQVLDTIDTVPVEILDLKDKYQTFNTQASIQLPEGVVANYDSVMIAVVISELSSSKTFDDFVVHERNLADGLEATLSAIGKKATITLTGPSNMVKQISRQDITAYVNLANYGAGSYTLPIEIELPDEFSSHVSATVVPSEAGVVIQNASTTE